MALCDLCPHCGSDQVGEPLPRKYLREDGPTHYSRTLLVEIPGEYDGALFFQCPDCHGRWHRWPIGSDLHKRAEKYVRQFDSME